MKDMSAKANEPRIGLGYKKAMKWSGNVQSCYVVGGYVYLKVRSCKKMANENIIL